MDKASVDREMDPYRAKRLQLKIAGRSSARHRRAMLVEAKLYTWLLLAIAIALIYAGTSDWAKFWVRAAIVLAGCLAGVVVALIGTGVIRREAESLDKNLEIYDRAAKALGMDEPTWAAPGRINKRCGRLLAGLLGSKKVKMETWDWFQATLLLAAATYFVAFVGVLVYAFVR
jgi:hypothetical protein